jgi:riboflavin transporter FmnP
MLALAAAVVVGLFAGFCVLLVLGGGAALLLEGGPLWPDWADPIMVAVSLLVFVVAAAVSFREIREKLTR